MNDPKNWRDFEEGGPPGPNLRARITETHLVVFGGHGAPTEYDLSKVQAVRRSRLPGGGPIVFTEMLGNGTSPGLTFEDAAVAGAFYDALIDAIGGPA